MAGVNFFRTSCDSNSAAGPSGSLASIVTLLTMICAACGVMTLLPASQATCVFVSGSAAAVLVVAAAALVTVFSCFFTGMVALLAGVGAVASGLAGTGADAG